MSLFTTLSLITAFFGGMVALFAPCCITFLLPSYLANIFKDRGRVVFSTLVFGLGLATVLVPTALGIRLIGQVFQDFHTQTYVAGGLFMVFLGIMELTGKKVTLPMLNITIDLNAKHDAWSVYLLGIISGITSSCCTPVLAGVLTLSFLSPSFFWAALAGFFYVAGMVFPLVVLSLLLDKINWATLPQLRNKAFSLFGSQVLVSDFIAGVIFITVGVVFTVLALAGKVAMGQEKPLEQTMSVQVLEIVRFLNNLPGFQYLFGALIVGLILYLVKKAGRKK
ncbi:MAG: cytochrome c biogenesis protein CcdA [Patescibacteria group bacterium]|nr:cytochrome c biogenesis protein CcdA [Patescibacteria group bacterium]